MLLIKPDGRTLHSSVPAEDWEPGDIVATHEGTKVPPHLANIYTEGEWDVKGIHCVVTGTAKVIVRGGTARVFGGRAVCFAGTECDVRGGKVLLAEPHCLAVLHDGHVVAMDGATVMASGGIVDAAGFCNVIAHDSTVVRLSECAVCHAFDKSVVTVMGHATAILYDQSEANGENVVDRRVEQCALAN